MKLKIENPTGGKFTANLSGVRFEIPSYAIGDKAVVKDLSDNSSTQEWIEYMRGAHRAVKITEVADSDELPDNAGSDDELPAKTPIKEPIKKLVKEFVKEPIKEFVEDLVKKLVKELVKKPSSIKVEDDANADPKIMLPLSMFQADALVEKGVSGWWTVLVDGIEEPFKVRGCDNDDAAILKAYEEYSEGE